MIPVAAFAAGGWWAGPGVASPLAALALTVITLVNRIERQAGLMLDLRS